VCSPYHCVSGCCVFCYPLSVWLLNVWYVVVASLHSVCCVVNAGFCVCYEV